MKSGTRLSALNPLTGDGILFLNSTGTNVQPIDIFSAGAVDAPCQNLDSMRTSLLLGKYVGMFMDTVDEGRGEKSFVATIDAAVEKAVISMAQLIDESVSMMAEW